MEIALRLRDFQAEWESPAFGLFRGAAFSTALLPTNCAKEPILFQADMRRRRAAAATVTLPLKMVGRFAFLAGLVVAMAVWYSVGSGVTSWREAVSTGSNQPAPVLFIAAASVPAFFVMALVLRTLWAED